MSALLTPIANMLLPSDGHPTGDLGTETCSNAVPNVAASRSRETTSMQAVSAHAGAGLQRAAPTPTVGLYGTLPGRGASSRLPVPEKIKHRAVAAHYLCTADARDLPSYPSAGLPHPGVAGAAAALLAQDSHRSVEIWRPDSISVAGAGAAASRAHANLKHMGIRKATPVKPAGNALHTLEGASSTQPYQMSEASKRWSLDGAIGAMQSSKARRRSVSSSMPLSIQLEAEAASAGKSALAAAATSTHMPSDKRKSDILRTATVSRPKNNRDTTLPPDINGHRSLVRPDLQRPATTPPTQRYNSSSIGEASRKVAAGRLAKFGYDTDIPRSDSLLGTQGARASLNRSYTVAGVGPGASAIDADNLARVDSKKREESAALLMSAAQRNVQARLSGIDKQVAESRGLVRRESWDTKSIGIAQAGSDKRMERHGKVDIGGGVYMTPGEIDAIAEKNIQPVLDEIDRGAEAGRARLEAGSARELGMHLDIEESKRVKELQQARERETREDTKKAKAVEKEEEKRRKEEEKRAMKERKQLAKIDSKRRRESMGAGGVADMRGPDPPTSPKSDNSEGGIRGLINRFKKRYSRQISPDEKNAIAGDAPAGGSSTFSGGHRAEQQQQQQNAAEANGGAVANGSASPRLPASRIPRPVTVPRTNGATATPGNRGSIRVVTITGAPPATSSAEVRRRHSLSSVGSAGHRFKGRKRGDDTVLSSWIEDPGVRKGKEKVNGKTTGAFSKANGRLVSAEDPSEYPDEARDTFSQQPTTLNRPTSGYFPQDERRFSAGETSMSSRFRENL